MNHLGIEQNQMSRISGQNKVYLITDVDYRGRLDEEEGSLERSVDK